MRRFVSFAALGGFVFACALLVSPLLAEAHEVRAIADGKYQVVVGFLNEPAFAGEENGLDLRVTAVSAATPTTGAESEGTPIEGLADTLQAEVIFGDQSMELSLSPVFNDPGAYKSVFFPMAPGDYTFRIFGKIGDADVDESFTSSPQGFGSVEDPTPLQFPKPES
jgi:hypothetical protein